MIIVIVLSHRFKINPDSIFFINLLKSIQLSNRFLIDVATPIAASLGDLTTLGLLAAIASFLFTAIGNFHLII